MASVTSPRPLLRSVAFAAFLVPAVAACGPSGPTAVAVQLAEWSVAPSVAKVPAGSAIFTVTNGGTQEHEMLVVRSDLAADALPVTDGAIEESAIESLGEVPETAVGATGTLRLDDLKAGHYILLCNIPGHYEQGMHADFTVE